MTDFTLKQLQTEHDPWEVKNFGKLPPEQPLLGIIEELGELYDANLNWDATVDAVGDVMVYTASLCTKMGFDLEDVATRSASMYQGRAMASLMGRLAHTQLKMLQGIRGTQDKHKEVLFGDLIEVVGRVRREFYGHPRSNNGFEFIDAVERTWSRVKQRDWTKDKMRGGEAADGST